MSKNTCQQDEWVLLIGGTSEERKRLSDDAYGSKECEESINAFCKYFYKSSRVTTELLYDYDRLFPNRNKFVLVDVDGCSSEEMSRKILGPEPEGEFKSPNDLLRNKPILNVLVQERLLFIDNFCCKNEYYIDVVKRISAQLRIYKSEYPEYKLGQLIVGVESKKDCEKWPHTFLKLFKSLYLEIEIDGKNKLLKYNGEEAKLEPKQIELFELLQNQKDITVRNTKINETLWPDYHKTHPLKYPVKSQIEQQVNKLRDGLEKLKLERNTIETIKETQLNEGGYQFHSNLTSFLKKSGS